MTNQRQPWLFCGISMGGNLFLLFAVVDVVALCGSENRLEVLEAILHEDVVPLQELLDVAVVYAVLVEVGQHLCEVVTQFLA